jgi:hypothetical protein
MELFPKARTEKLVVQDFNDELLVYDKQRHQAHCLNHTAALIWKQCNGRNSVAAISRHLEKQLGAENEIDERVIWYALRQFERDHLLQQKLDVPTTGRMGRRQLIRVLGLTAIVALPLVTSMASPDAGQATSCLGPGASCSSSIQCCNAVCNAGTCN